MPNSVYNGQKLIKLVANKIPPNARSTNPKEPATVPVKNSTEKKTAVMMRMILSVEPTFVFIILWIK
jgi:hypothetical protein